MEVGGVHTRLSVPESQTKRSTSKQSCIPQHLEPFLDWIAEKIANDVLASEIIAASDNNNGEKQ